MLFSVRSATIVLFAIMVQMAALAQCTQILQVVVLDVVVHMRDRQYYLGSRLRMLGVIRDTTIRMLRRPFTAIARSRDHFWTYPSVPIRRVFRVVYWHGSPKVFIVGHQTKYIHWEITFRLRVNEAASLDHFLPMPVHK